MKSRSVIVLNCKIVFFKHIELTAMAETEKQGVRGVRNQPHRSCLKLFNNGEATKNETYKKSRNVHFADSCGMALASIHTFQYSDEMYRFSFRPELTLYRRPPKEKNRLLNFVQPITLQFFNEKVESNGVSLGTIVFRESSIFGTVVVSNIAFDKRVSVRYTTSSWKSSEEVSAWYVHGTNTAKTDTFNFEIFIPARYESVVKFEFAVKYEASDQIFWDNNFGENYQLLCHGKSELDEIQNERADELDIYRWKISTFSDCLCDIHKRLPVLKRCTDSMILFHS